jgi:hypothetical protein
MIRPAALKPCGLNPSGFTCNEDRNADTASREDWRCGIHRLAGTLHNPMRMILGKLRPLLFMVARPLPKKTEPARSA